MSGYLGSIGFSFPAAIGAWAAYPQKKVIAVAGDGGFAKYMAEFTTAVKYNMNISLILLNNNELGKISREQRNAKLHVWETNLINPNFADFAISCGGKGYRVETEDQLKTAIEKSLNYKGPSIVEILSSSDQL